MSNGELVDQRRHQFFQVDDEVVDYYAEVIGAYGLAVYVALCRRANRERACWPGLTKIGKDSGMSRQTVLKALERLSGEDGVLGAAGLPPLIRVEAQVRPDGGQTTNRYTLLPVAKAEMPGSPYASRGDGGVREADWGDTREGQGESLSGTGGGTREGHEVDTDEGDTVKETQVKERDDPPPTEPTGKPDPVPEPSEPNPPKPEPENPPEPPRDRNGRTDGQVYALVDAFHKAKGVKPKSVPVRMRKMDFNLFRELPEEVRPEDVVDCVRYMESDPWWREPGRLTSRKVFEVVPEWIAKGRPEAMVPKQAQRQAGGPGPGRFSRLLEQMKQDGRVQ